MRVGKTYYVCFKMEEVIRYVTPNGYLTDFLESALRFSSEEDAADAIRISKENHADDEFAYMNDFDVYAGCSVGEIYNILTEVNRTNYTVEELDFSVRTYVALKRKGINTLASLLDLTKDELLNVRNINLKSAKEIEDRLSLMGLSLRS